MTTDTPIYDDLIIRFEAAPTGQSYSAQIVNSPCGRSESIPLSPSLFDPRGQRLWENLEAMIWRETEESIASPRDARTPSRTGNIDPELLGRQLFDTLFTGSIREIFVRSFAAVSGHERRKLRISLELAPEVVGVVGSLPWELLHCGEPAAFLGRNSQTPLVRRLDMNQLHLTPRPVATLRVLAVLSNPERSQPLNIAREKQLMEDALGSLDGVDLQFLKKPTIEELRKRLRGDSPFDVLHFAGHGGFDPQSEGFLCFEDDERQERAVTGSILAENLAGESIRLVFLNACNTARLPQTELGGDPYQGAASALLMAGVPAVVAMQFPITDRAAASFSGELYCALAQDIPLESAVVEGRLALRRARPSSWEWATPVLYLGVRDGNLFQISTCSDPADDEAEALPDIALSAPGQRRQQAQALESALEMIDYQRYEEALEKFPASEDAQDDTSFFFYRALARLGGRRPRSARPGVIQKIESDLWQAGQRSLGQEPAHLWLFRALIQHDYYRMNGLRIKPPTIEELLQEVQAAPVDQDPTHLQRLLDHVPTPPNPVRHAINERLSTLRGN